MTKLIDSPNQVAVSQCLIRSAIINPDRGISRARLAGKLFGNRVAHLVQCVHEPPCAQPNKEKTLQFQRQFPEILQKLEQIKL